MGWGGGGGFGNHPVPCSKSLGGARDQQAPTVPCQGQGRPCGEKVGERPSQGTEKCGDHVQVSQDTGPSIRPYQGLLCLPNKATV